MHPGRSLTANFRSLRKASKDLKFTPPAALPLSLEDDEALLLPLELEDEEEELDDEDVLPNEDTGVNGNERGKKLKVSKQGGG